MTSCQSVPATFQAEPGRADAVSTFQIPLSGRLLGFHEYSPKL